MQTQKPDKESDQILKAVLMGFMLPPLFLLWVAYVSAQ